MQDPLWTPDTKAARSFNNVADAIHRRQSSEEAAIAQAQAKAQAEAEAAARRQQEEEAEKKAAAAGQRKCKECGKMTNSPCR